MEKELFNESRLKESINDIKLSIKQKSAFKEWLELISKRELLKEKKIIEESLK